MIRLRDYLEGMRSATTADELEGAIQAPFEHSFSGRTWATICRVRIEAGNRIVDADPHAFYIPRLRGRRLICCGEGYKVGRGQNSTGIRYAWHAAGEWARGRLRENGFGVRAAHLMLDGSWYDYPHRSIGLVDEILAKRVIDPELGVLIRQERCGSAGGPVKYTVAQNNADELDRRATRQCGCGGTLFDWGGGFSGGFDFINWHCNGCPDVFTEYMSEERFCELRSRRAA